MNDFDTYDKSLDNQPRQPQPVVDTSILPLMEAAHDIDDSIETDGTDAHADTVPEDKTPFNLSDRFYNELKSGAQVHPQYEPQTGEEGKEFYQHKFVDQKVIHDNRMYEKPIHRFRTLETDDNELPKKISEIFDESITDFKSLVPLKNGKLGDSIIDGGFNLGSFTPDFITYENEKPENGGLLDKLTFFGYDPMIQTDSAIF